MDSASTIAAFLAACAFEDDRPEAPHLEVGGMGSLPSAFAVTELATAAVGVAAQALAQYMRLGFGRPPAVRVDRRLASFWFASSLRPQGWSPPDARDAVTGDYACRDGWIRLHANMPPHRAAELAVLGAAPEHDAVARAVAGWDVQELEAAIVAAGGCAAMMRTREAWAAHPQGAAVAAEPLFQVIPGAGQAPGEPPAAAQATADRPLAGLKVLDLTRVLAGPVSTRFLAGYGAQVLRLDASFWVEPGMVPEVTLGKRCALLDLKDEAGRRQFAALLAQADVLVHGWRPDALERLGLGAERRQQIRPGLVDVCLDAYGWTGPWRGRRGFDSLVQMSNGFAHAGMLHYGRERPTPLPVQALDQATGYLMAAAVLRGLARRLEHGAGSMTRLSLARTAVLLNSQSAPSAAQDLEPETAADLAPAIERTEWGSARRLRPPCEVEGAPMRWDLPASPLRSAPPLWQDGK
ncbi:CoA transferase [Candidimonas nitroreducens]|uniref:Acyl-CoA transferase n=1 Tax=Candidimonas nitroreducens TaxID=683354 RepID=A0A225MR19_9BURK|nr:CoA transferase [Candidimonas nitroreducens]OWT63696.1 acyl-CoA transferase [Candidimonas nitroreducens]